MIKTTTLKTYYLFYKLTILINGMERIKIVIVTITADEVMCLLLINNNIKVCFIFYYSNRHLTPVIVLKPRKT